MADDGVTIRPTDVEFTESRLSIRSTSLANDLVHNRDDTLAFLSEQVSPVKLADITLDDAGRVVVQNKVFVDTARKKIDEGVNMTDAAGEIGC